MIRLSPKEIVEAFPEGKYLLKVKIRETKEEMKPFEKYLKDLYNRSNDADLKMFMTKYVRAFHYNILQKTHQRLKREYAMYDTNRKELDVATAKTILIESLYSFERVRTTSNRITTKCPFHDEKHPSFVIYKHNNSFHCFSCMTSGDSISFVMKLNDITFIPAVKYLLATRG